MFFSPSAAWCEPCQMAEPIFSSLICQQFREPRSEPICLLALEMSSQLGPLYPTILNRKKKKYTAHLVCRLNMLSPQRTSFSQPSSYLNRMRGWFCTEHGQQPQAKAFHVEQGIFFGGERRMHLFQHLKPIKTTFSSMIHAPNICAN